MKKHLKNPVAHSSVQQGGNYRRFEMISCSDSDYFVGSVGLVAWRCFTFWFSDVVIWST